MGSTSVIRQSVARRPMEAEVLCLPAVRMLRTRAVAELLDLPERRIYELVRAGLIPHVRVGRSVRFNSQRLEEWIEAGGTGYPGTES